MKEKMFVLNIFVLLATLQQVQLTEANFDNSNKNASSQAPLPTVAGTTIVAGIKLKEITDAVNLSVASTTNFTSEGPQKSESLVSEQATLTMKKDEISGMNTGTIAKKGETNITATSPAGKRNEQIRTQSTENNEVQSTSQNPRRSDNDQSNEENVSSQSEDVQSYFIPERSGRPSHRGSYNNDNRPQRVNYRPTQGRPQDWPWFGFQFNEPYGNEPHQAQYWPDPEYSNSYQNPQHEGLWSDRKQFREPKRHHFAQGQLLQQSLQQEFREPNRHSLVQDQPLPQSGFFESYFDERRNQHQGRTLLNHDLSSFPSPQLQNSLEFPKYNYEFVPPRFDNQQNFPQRPGGNHFQNSGIPESDYFPEKQTYFPNFEVDDRSPFAQDHIRQPFHQHLQDN